MGKVFQMCQCNIFLIQISHLISHLLFKSFYQSSDTRWGNDFQYDPCGKTNYTSKCTYQLSENIKWGKLFKCDQCNIFIQRSHLISHQYTQSGINRFSM